MKKRWFVVILTIGLLLHVLPLSVLALSPDPTITDSDGTILDWSDLSTVPYSLDDSQEQEPPVPDLLETGSEKSLADADNDEAPADDLPAGNPTPPPSLLTRNWRAMPLRTTTTAPQPRLCARSTRSTIRTTTPHWTMQSLRRRMVIRSTC